MQVIQVIIVILILLVILGIMIEMVYVAPRKNETKYKNTSRKGEKHMDTKLYDYERKKEKHDIYRFVRRFVFRFVYRRRARLRSDNGKFAAKACQSQMGRLCRQTI